MYSLFSSAPSDAGYRLDYMEVFNWGTFDKEIFRISPKGNTSLLTGANGSGKTTYVDALLTLLVPIKKFRFYNRSSGTNKKNERTEHSYVLGAIGDTQEEGKLHSKTIYLRPDKKRVYSILSACFHDAGKRPITLFQARWFFNGELKRSYGICRGKLSIERDFYPFDPKGDWKKTLKKRFPQKGTKETVMFFDTSTKYANKILKLFGMRSEKALSLFNQTVGIKVLGNLDLFIRTNMLEPQESEEEFFKLKENYNTLLDAHKQIEKAAEQVKRLTPVRDLACQVAALNTELSKLARLKETRNLYLNSRLDEFLTGEIEQKERALDITQQNLQVIEKELDSRGDQKTNLMVAIEKDETGRRLKEIGQELRRKESEKSGCKKKQDQYNLLAAQLQLTGTPDKHLFFGNRERALQLKDKIERDEKTIDSRRFYLRKETVDKGHDLDVLKKEVQQLRNQKNKITGRVSEIRDEILSHVKAAPDEIPFIGELIKVKESQKEWEPAIERLLHNFALRLLVPERHYAKVNRYVNENNLRGRIVYHRVKEESFVNKMLSRPPGMVLEKLDLKKSVYRDWIENQLLTHYDYICVDHVARLREFNRALTMQGLIKNKDHHQKDDRPGFTSSERYVLGWDNKEKIKTLALKVQALQKEIDQKNNQLSEIEKQLKQLRVNRDKLLELLTYEAYADIDWQSVASKIEELEQEKKRLEETSDFIKQLQAELKEVESEIKKLNGERDQLKGVQALTENTIREYRHEQENCRREIQEAPFSGDRLQERFHEFEEAYPGFLENLSYQNFPRVQKKLEIEQSNKNESLNQKVHKTETRLVSKMNDFKNPGPDITDRFHDWGADTHKLSEEVDFVDEYVALLEKIEKEDLPSYRRKFEDYLSSTMINKIAGFNELLDSGEEAIIENIKILNRSLEKISFKNTPSTYIQLKFPPKQDVEIKEFKKMLREAIPDIKRLYAEDNGDYKKQVFGKIQALIDKLFTDENWRKKVIDVRNWKTYYAEEFYREDNSPMKVYKDMEKLSGGEKAQLTYTILGSAIAYQFGIKHDGRENDSFRFIAVDETFSNQDDERATYLMDLCEQLHLQLLVVTPSDKIHIVEPYISYVHYVQRRSNRDSILFDMPIVQFQEQKQQILSAGPEELKN